MFQFFLWIINIGNIRPFWHRKVYIKTCLSSKYMWILTIFFYDFLCQNVLIPLSPKISQRAKRAKLYTTISRRTTFSPNPRLVEEATCFTFFAPWYGSNWTTQPYVSGRTQMLSPTQMGLLLINCYYHEFGNTES